MCWMGWRRGKLGVGDAIRGGGQDARSANKVVGGSERRAVSPGVAGATLTKVAVAGALAGQRPVKRA